MKRVDLPYGDDPPPAFSRFRRRLDPILAAEDSNELYRAFRLRRTVHANRRTRMTVLNVAIICGLIASSVGCARHFFRVPWPGILGVSVLAALLIWIAGLPVRRGRWALSRSLKFLGQSLQKNDPYVIGDLLCLGRHSPAGIVEALYLERREGHLFWGLVLGIAAFVTGILTAYWSSQGLHAYHGLFLLVLMVLSLETVLVADAILGYLQVAVICLTLDTWEVFHAIKRDLRWWTRSLGWMLLYAALSFTMIFCLYGLMWTFFDRGSPVHQFIEFLPFLFGEWNSHAIVCLMVFALTEGFRRAISRVSLLEFEQQCRRAPLLFECLVGRVVCADPEATALAIARHGKPLSSNPPLRSWVRCLFFGR